MRCWTAWSRSMRATTAGAGKPESRGRGMANANKSLLVLAVEKVAVAPGKGVEGSGFVAGRARLAILPRANAEQLGGFRAGRRDAGARAC